MSASEFTAVVTQDGERFIALCPEFDMASEGSSVAESIANLRNAVEQFLKTADSAVVDWRHHEVVRIATFDLTPT
jgi:predicted RNase H-like HicB family nuclease